MDHIHEIRSRKETFAVTSKLYLIMEKFGFKNLHRLLTESSYNVVMLPGLVCLRWKLGLLFRQFVVNILPLSNMNLMMTQIQNHSTDWMQMQKLSIVNRSRTLLTYTHYTTGRKRRSSMLACIDRGPGVTSLLRIS